MNDGLWSTPTGFRVFCKTHRLDWTGATSVSHAWNFLRKHAREEHAGEYLVWGDEQQAADAGDLVAPF